MQHAISQQVYDWFFFPEAENSPNNEVGSGTSAKVVKRTRENFQFTISKENFESFCDSIGLYHREFLEALVASE